LQYISANSYCCMRADVGIGPYNDLLDKSEFVHKNSIGSPER